MRCSANPTSTSPAKPDARRAGVDLVASDGPVEQRSRPGRPDPPATGRRELIKYDAAAMAELSPSADQRLPVSTPTARGHGRTFKVLAVESHEVTVKNHAVTGRDVGRARPRRTVAT